MFILITWANIGVNHGCILFFHVRVIRVTTLKMAGSQWSYRRKVQQNALAKVDRVKEIRRRGKNSLKITDTSRKCEVMGRVCEVSLGKGEEVVMERVEGEWEAAVQQLLKSLDLPGLTNPSPTFHHFLHVWILGAQKVLRICTSFPLLQTNLDPPYSARSV